MDARTQPQPVHSLSISVQLTNRRRVSIFFSKRKIIRSEPVDAVGKYIYKFFFAAYPLTSNAATVQLLSQPKVRMESGAIGCLHCFDIYSHTSIREIGAAIKRGNIYETNAEKQRLSAWNFQSLNCSSSITTEAIFGVGSLKGKISFGFSFHFGWRNSSKCVYGYHLIAHTTLMSSITLCAFFFIFF